MKEEKSDIEKFFSAGLTEGNIPFEESDWEAMEQKLNDFDALAATSAPDWTRWIAGAGLAVLLFTAGWFSHQWLIDDRDAIGSERLENLASGNPDLTIAHPDEKDTETKDSGISSRPEPGPAGANTSSANSLSSSEPVLQAGDQSRVETGKTPTPEDSGDRNSNAADVDGHEASTEAESGERKVTGEETGKSAGAAALAAAGEGPARERAEEGRNTEYIPTANFTAGNVTATSGIKYEVISPDLERLARLDPEWSMNLPFAIMEGREAEIQPAGAHFPAWEIGITIAPDLNGVGAMENYKLAWEAGLSVYYNLSSRWRLSSGVYYAKKTYLASGSDYSPPEGYWDYHTNGIIPEEVDAKCGILDIPVNLTYSWNPQQKFRITTTLGLSNYLILNEDYQYSFGYNKPYSGYDNWSTDENSAAFFGMFNAGIGAEWNIRPGLVMAAEPYVKVPLKEVGFGNVPLTGTGIYFTLRKQLSK